MKRLKKIMALVIAMVMVVGMSTVAFAAANDYTITVDNAVKGETYTAYKVFDVTYSGDNATPGELPTAPSADNRNLHTAYSYTITNSSEWWSVIVGTATADSDGVYTANGLQFTPTSPSGTYIVTATESFNAATFAALLNNNKTGKTATNFATATGTSVQIELTNGQNNNAETPAAITNGGPGYYFVDTSLGSLCSLDTTEPTATIREKNTTTTQDKAVQENSNKGTGTDGDGKSGYGDKNDVNVGDTVYFATKITIGAHQSNVVYHDIMQLEKLALNWDSVKVYTADASGNITTTELVSSNIDAIYYAAHGETVSTIPSDTKYTDDTFAIKFKNDYTEALTSDTVLYVTYNATLTTSAVVGSQTGDVGTGNDNKSSVTYGDDQRTTWDWTRTYTWGFDVYKYAGELAAATIEYAAKDMYADETAATEAGFSQNTDDTDELKDTTHYWVKETAAKTGNPLANASFQLSTTSGGTAIKLISTDTNVYRLATATEIADSNVTKIDTITTDSTGKFTINGLDAGTYYLTETAAPSGYNKLKDPITVVIDSNTDSAQGTDGTHQKDGSATITQNGTTVSEIDVLNQSGSELPSTGGMGTTIFYIVGAILVVGAGVVLITRRRMRAE